MRRMLTRGRAKRRTLAAAIGAAALAVPATASAETVTIGNPLTHTVNGGECSAPCTGVQLTQATGGLPLISPVNGTVTGWAVRSNTTGVLYALRILRPVSGVTYSFQGSSTGTTTGPMPPVDGSVFNFPASVPIAQGDAIGLGVPMQGVPYNVPIHTGDPAQAGDSIAYHQGFPPDGQSGAFDFNMNPVREVLVQATISFCRVPTVVGQQVAVAQSVLSAATCGSRVTIKKLRRTKKNRKKRGLVLSQGTQPGTTVAPGTPVDLTVAGLKKKKKKKNRRPSAY